MTKNHKKGKIISTQKIEKSPGTIQFQEIFERKLCDIDFQSG